MPKISVIVPVYKVEKYIHRCVDSILNQTFADFELILVDDGSPDNCGAICDEYAAKDNRVVVIHQENGGLSAARNAGLDWVYIHSNSEWLTFIDSDDWVHLEYLSFLYNNAVQHKVKISICAFSRTEGIDNNPIDYQPVKILTPEQAYLRDHNHVTAFACGSLYHRSCYKTIRFPVGKLFEDIFTTYMALFATDRIAYSDTAMYFYYVNQDGITQEKWKPERLNQLEAFEKQLGWFSEEKPDCFEDVFVSYVRTIVVQYIRFSNLTVEEQRVYSYYRRLLKHKMRRNVSIAHLKRYISISDEAYLYENAFPILMRMYWYWVALLRKIGVRK